MACKRASTEYVVGQWLSYRLWSEADFVTVPQARFALLMIALEALADAGPRSGAALAHVDSLIECTKRATIPDDERGSLLGALSSLRRESVRSACLRLAEEEGRTYGGRTARQFVAHCYNRRNALVHGRDDFPTFDEANALAGELSRFVGDVLAGPELVEEVQRARHSPSE